MTLDTYSISQAVLALERRQRQKQPLNFTSAPIDVVAVVSGISTLKSPPTSSHTTMPRVDLRIIDQSIPSNAVAKVSLYGSVELARISEEQISPGDVIRFNQLGLGRQHLPQDSPSSSVGNDNVLLHFEHPMNHLEPGLRWFKLGRIRVSNKIESTDDCSSPGGSTSRRQRAFLTDDRRQAWSFPSEMVTSESRIKELLIWFAARGHSHAQDGRESSATTAAAAAGPNRSISITNNSRSLSPLPCKRRSLAEIQVSSGILSNIVVRIIHSDSQVVPLQAERKRTSAARPRQRQVIGFASLTDHSGTVMSFVDPGDRFGSTLRAARQVHGEIRSVMMTSVISTKQSEIYGRPLVCEEVVLWPTRQTTVSIVEGTTGSVEEQMERVDVQGALLLPTSPRSLRIRGARLGVVRMMSQEDMETQLTQDIEMSRDGCDRHGETRSCFLSMKSNIDDISVNGKSLRQNLLNWTPLQLKENLVSSCGMKYLSVMIRLKPIRSQDVNESVKMIQESSYLAESSVVQCLCGGIAPMEWNVQVTGDQEQQCLQDDSSRTNDCVSCTLGVHALRLLCGLLYENVSLKWTIDVSREPPQIEKVRLSTI